MPNHNDVSELLVQTHTSIAEIGEASWNQLVGPAGSPFLEYGFLRALETTGCVDGRTGWHTALITAKRRDRTLIGALPFYIKTHSQGEFVYDWGWADGAMRSGIEYYPKGVIAAPMTPVTGERLLTAPGVESSVEERRAARTALVAGAIEVAKAANLSSLHFNFITEDEVAFFRELGMPIRTQLQYHWANGRAGRAAVYECFDDYLAQFRSKRRANIRRERRKLAEAGVTTRVIEGEELSPAQMRKTYRYYVDTVRKFYWGNQYLTEDFFQEILEHQRERLHLVVAERDGEQIGGTFNLFKDDRLYGRYWGCVDQVDYAHFEVCMYTPIEWCIEHGVAVFEPGHGGEHKHERGFEPVKTYSAHWIADPAFAHAIDDFCAREDALIDQRLEALHEDSPLK